MKTILRVYVSSTFGDLKEHRSAVLDAIRRTGAVSVAMETFGATSELPVDACRDQIHASDVMVLVVAHRYGATPRGQDRSYTELEYDFAQQAGVPVLAFLLAEDQPWPPGLIDSGDASHRLETFKKRLRETLVVDFFTSPSDLALRVSRALHRFILETGRDAEHVLQTESTAASVGH